MHSNCLNKKLLLAFKYLLERAEHEREREREHCLLQLDELDSNYDKNTQLYIIMYDKVNIKINIHIISH